jgi:Na+-transporting methylmalonyl-CoA/oxaloacetate decarboxylase gamma subunit
VDARALLDPLSLGLTLTVLGMGGTLLTLFIISLIVDLLKRLFPIPPPPPPAATPPNAPASPPPAAT